MVLAFSMMSFTSNIEIENNETLGVSNLIEIVEENSFCDYYTRRCFYQGGVLLGCTAWECVIVLNEIVITAGSN